MSDPHLVTFAAPAGLARAVGADAADGRSPLKQRLRRAERRARLRAYALIAPLLLFILLSFLVPIGMMLVNSIHDPLVSDVLPRTARLLDRLPAQAQVPDEPAFAALAEDMKAAAEAQTASRVASRLNFEQSGLRTLFMKTVRGMAGADAGEPGSWKQRFVQIDPAWDEPGIWTVLRQTARTPTAGYYLAALDLRRDAQDRFERLPEGDRLYLDVFGRTIWLSVLVTLACLAIGYPLAYWLAAKPAKTGNLLMVLVLLPFWTSLLVRTTAWIVLLQKEGVVNSALQALGLIREPLELMFNRFGVVAGMTHILLPFMILPLYSVMKQIPPAYVRAARSLGASPATAFLRVYVPQSMPGVGAGVLLVFILALGYYITPALLGGAADQMMSYFIADHLTRSLNWGLASALGGLLLAGVLVLYVVYERIVGVGNVRLG
ncbi:ABC transporter permease [Piscinibacter defluvii]|uniref:ABC transporter permease n=1 Tax=Piscinibacter defluvii TaxID=1796922 RepID=UPI000FDE11D3|nr:ABC transporter permease [Piscinibacter defluvii]